MKDVLKLDKPPISQAIIGLKFSEELLDLNDITNVYVNHFEDNYISEETYRVSLEEGNLVQKQEVENFGIRISSEELKQVIFIEKDRVSFIKEKPYFDEGGEKLFSSFVEVLSYFRDNIKFNLIADFGIRYRNKIVIEEEEFEKHFLLKPKIKSDMNIQRFKESYILDNENIYSVVLLNVEKDDKTSSSLNVLFDIDVHFKKPIFSSVEDIKESFDELRVVKNKIFFENIKDVCDMKEFKNG